MQTIPSRRNALLIHRAIYVGGRRLECRRAFCDFFDHSLLFFAFFKRFFMCRGFDSSTMVSFVLANKSEKKLLIHTSYVTFIQQNIARSQTRLRGSIKITLAESTVEFPVTVDFFRRSSEDLLGFRRAISGIYRRRLFPGLGFRNFIAGERLDTGGGPREFIISFFFSRKNRVDSASFLSS